jgi:cell wall-associated NlpC family hydrolase
VKRFVGTMLGLAFVAVLLAVLGVFAGGSTRAATAGTGTVRHADAPAAAGKADLPPLPTKSRAQVVEPEAGAGDDSSASSGPADDPGLTSAAPAPKAAASSGGRKPSGVLGEARGAGVHHAYALSNGVALPPLDAPEEVKQIIEAGNAIARTPYKWGGGHGKWQDTGYDCSGSVSFALAAAGLLDGPLASGPLMSWGKPGPGRWVTIYANAGHTYLVVAGIRFDTSAAKVTGSRWENDLRDNVGFTARHPAGL